MLGIVCVVSTAVDGLSKELATVCLWLAAFYCGNEIKCFKFWLCV